MASHRKNLPRGFSPTNQATTPLNNQQKRPSAQPPSPYKYTFLYKHCTILCVLPSLVNCENGRISSTKFKLFFWHTISASSVHNTAIIGPYAPCINSNAVCEHCAMTTPVKMYYYEANLGGILFLFPHACFRSSTELQVLVLGDHFPSNSASARPRKHYQIV